MDIVTYTGSVMGVIVISEYPKLLQFANCHLCDVRHQVVGDTVGILADGSAYVSSDGIEVTKQNHIPFRICLLHICENLLQHGLSPAVRIGALSLRAFLGDGNDGRVTVNSRRRRKDNVLHAVLSHHIHQCQSTCNIVLIIFPWLLHGFAHCL